MDPQSDLWAQLDEVMNQLLAITVPQPCRSIIRLTLRCSSREAMRRSHLGGKEDRWVDSTAGRAGTILLHTELELVQSTSESSGWNNGPLGINWIEDPTAMSYRR